MGTVRPNSKQGIANNLNIIFPFIMKKSRLGGNCLLGRCSTNCVTEAAQVAGLSHGRGGGGGV